MFTVVRKKMSREMMPDKRINAAVRAKKTPPFQGTGFTLRSRACFLFVTAFGSLERIDFLLDCGSSGCGHMRCKIASSAFPFDSRIRACRAIPGGIELDIAVAAVALFHDLMANPAIE